MQYLFKYLPPLYFESIISFILERREQFCFERIAFPQMYTSISFTLDVVRVCTSTSNKIFTILQVDLTINYWNIEYLFWLHHNNYKRVCFKFLHVLSSHKWSESSVCLLLHTRGNIAESVNVMWVLILNDPWSEFFQWKKHSRSNMSLFLVDCHSVWWKS